MGDSFSLAGAAKFIRLPPGLQNPRGRVCLQMGSATQISNFFEIEFTRLTPLLNFCYSHKFKSLKPSRPVPSFPSKFDMGNGNNPDIVITVFL
ncbi:hypothetical protein A7983_22795 [Pectobacterium wasabiae CFBP 3304]|nr:hypothetical protein A7983_22795 [Pectobacterium wasabiae CFBP 3304]